MHNALLCPARKPAFCGKIRIPLSSLRLRGQQAYLFRHGCAVTPSPRGRLNSLSQSLTALTAPSEREPLAYPQMPSRENEIAKRPQTLRYLEIKIIFPLIMPKAHAAGIPNRPLLLRHGLQHRLLQVGDRDGAQRLQVGIRAVCGEFADLHGIFALQVAAPACAVLVPLLA